MANRAGRHVRVFRDGTRRSLASVLLERVDDVLIEVVESFVAHTFGVGRDSERTIQLSTAALVAVSAWWFRQTNIA
jgi:hypothetical protein